MKKNIFIAIAVIAVVAFGQEAGDMAQADAAYDVASKWIGQLTVILTAVAALDPTNKVQKILSKVFAFTKAFGFADKDKGK